MTELPLAVAVAAGMLAAVNPCGFALLPAYLSLLVLGDHPGGRGPAVVRALGLTAAMSVGFVAVFGAFGLAVAPVAGGVQEHLPWFTIVLGLLVAAAGGWLLAGRDLPAPRLRRGAALTGSVRSMVTFGAAYAVASLGCTIGPFLAIVVTSFRAGSIANGFALFAAYAAGMGLVVGVAAVAVALAQTALLGRLRRVGRLVPRLGGALLLTVGLYVAYYGWYEVRTYRGVPAADPLIDAAAYVQHRLAAGVERLGAPAFVVILIAVLAGVLVARALLRVRPRRDRQVAPGDSSPVPDAPGDHRD